jgi:hypothetical protein
MVRVELPGGSARTASMEATDTEREAHRTAGEFLQAQQHFYTKLKAKKDELQRYRTTRQQHEDASKLLAELPNKVSSREREHRIGDRGPGQTPKSSL